MLQSMKGQRLAGSILLTFLLNPLAQAATDVLPSSVDPGVIGNRLTAPPIEAPNVNAAPLPKPAESESALGPQAAKIKFKLTKIILEGNTKFSDKELLPL